MNKLNNKMNSFIKMANSSMDESDNEFNKFFNIEENFYSLIDKLKYISEIQENIFEDLNYILYNKEIQKNKEAEYIFENIQKNINNIYKNENFELNFYNNLYFLIQEKVIKRIKDLNYIKSILSKEKYISKEYKTTILNYLKIKTLLDNENSFSNQFSDIFETIFIELSKDKKFKEIIKNDFEIRKILNYLDINQNIKNLENLIKKNILKNNEIKEKILNIEKKIKNKYNIDKNLIKKINQLKLKYFEINELSLKIPKLIISE